MANVVYVILKLALCTCLWAYVETLDCYKCTSLSSSSDCHTVDICPSGLICYTERTGSGSHTSYTLGCKLPQNCQSTLTVVGRDMMSLMTSRGDVCSSCCDTDACNKHLCEITQPTTTPGVQTAGHCVDHVTNCEALKEFVCMDATFNTQCAKTCGLCIDKTVTTTTLSSTTTASHWSEWSSWNCSVTIDSCYIRRLRQCSGTIACHGSHIELSICDESICPNGVSLVKAADDLSHLCDNLMALDCKTQYQKGERDEMVCGNDGVTYHNFCYYSQARCVDRNISIVYPGRCSTTVTITMASGTGSTVPAQGGSTMPSTTMGTTTAIPLFCQTKNSITCPQDVDPICGSDGKFYLNQCEFVKAYCENTTLIAFCT